MAFLRNRNGVNYEILASRPSRFIKGHNDYLVKSPNGGVTIAHGWEPKKKEWRQSSFYGWGKNAEREARKDFVAGRNYGR